MSLKAMPLLFLNMGGEMIYILDQRLRAQEIHQGKAGKGEMFCRVLAAYSGPVVA